ncbi:MAG: type II secretion system F family protein [Bacillota bacterium]|nr:type II secretion system F family protein [Bacillota bacterium]
MAKFRYLARDKQGNTISGMMNAADEDELYRRLKEEDKFLISTESGMEGFSTSQLPLLMLSEFNRELGDMLGAGVTLVRALTILSQEETRKPKERAVLAAVLKLIRQGASISDAMEQQNGAFPILMVNMYRAAETSGKLAETAKRLSVHYEKEHQLNIKIRSATIYPKILTFLVFVVLVFIMTFILPQLTSLFDSLEELPGPTKVLFSISDFVGGHWKALLALLVVVFVIVQMLGRMPTVRAWRDGMKLRIPVIGKLLMVIYTARFARNLSSLYSSGIPIITAMQISRKTIGNTFIERQFDGAIGCLRAGGSLSDALESIEGFRKKLPSVVRVGEESGDLVQMLDAMADSFDYESEMAINRMISYLEPVLITAMAVLIGFIMIAVMMPIYESYSAIGSTAYY